MNISQSINTKKILTLAEIYEQYPNQWVLIVEPELDENLEVIRGEVIAFSPERDGLYDQLYLREGKSCAIEYTGSTEGDVVIPDYHIISYQK
jgi:hypothetical protein